ncbi:hypothetical protein Pint_24521 [Pistacia integerrima]|uniref:Uncharacterized protein n=1 Tax=Pistacia integerrima TaxID=434235 RepID=A0ACC0YCI6_9ROSI|nr:hypothetical protein Pint_24521 [Pistacia integerrima]
MEIREDIVCRKAGSVNCSCTCFWVLCAVTRDAISDKPDSPNSSVVSLQGM